MNLNKLAAEITESEGLKESVSIAQVKEVMKLLFKKLAKLSLYDLASVLKRYRG